MKNLTFDLTERVKQIIEYYGLNPYSMSVKISVSEGTIRKFLAGQIGMKVETLTKILTIFDEISSDWLILGKGEMLRQNVPVSTEKYTCDEQRVPQNVNQGTFPADNAMCEKIIADLRARTPSQGFSWLQAMRRSSMHPTAPYSRRFPWPLNG